MPHFKNENNQLFWLDEHDNPAVWLPQCTPITNEEADAIRLQLSQAIEAAKTYADLRAQAYPSIAEQLDDIFHNGLDGWKETIQAVKDKYPK
jgi:hypothetical protein